MKSLKIKSAAFNNRRKILTVTYQDGRAFDVHYAQLGILKNIESVWVDKETRGMSLGLKFIDGSEDFMPYDQPLMLNNDASYVLHAQVEKLVAQVKQTLVDKKMSKRFIAEKLGTSDNQVQRLFKPDVLDKRFNQLQKLLTLLGLRWEWELKKMA